MGLQGLDDYVKQHRSLQDSISGFLLLKKPFLCFNQLLRHRRILLLYFGSYTATPCSLSKSLIQVRDTLLKAYLKIYLAKILGFD